MTKIIPPHTVRLTKDLAVYLVFILITIAHSRYGTDPLSQIATVLFVTFPGWLLIVDPSIVYDLMRRPVRGGKR